jgi:hypothetical protein
MVDETMATTECSAISAFIRQIPKSALTKTAAVNGQQGIMAILVRLESNP